MKRTISLIAALFIIALIAGCAKESGPTEIKKERFAAFAESQRLEEQIKQYKTEIKQREEKIKEQQKQINELSKQIDDLQKQVGGEIEKNMAAIRQGMLDENAKLRQEIEQLKK